MFSHPDSSSTCFLVYSIVEAMCGTGAITRRMAESLYVGMMTDTGNFAFSFLTPELFRAVAVLVEKGISIPDIHNSVYNAYTEGPCAAVRLRHQPQDGGDPGRDGGLYVLAGERDAPIPVPAGRQRGVRQLRPLRSRRSRCRPCSSPTLRVHPRVAALAGDVDVNLSPGNISAAAASRTPRGGAGYRSSRCGGTIDHPIRSG